MTIDELVAAIDAKAEQALPPAAARLFGPSKVPPPLLDEIEAFEADVGSKLPQDYREFLTRSNGGYIDWHEFDVPIAMGLVSRVGGLRAEPELSLRFARACFQGNELQIPRALLWIMSDPGGNAICIGLTGKHRGRMYFWVHDEQPDPDEWDGEVETAGNIRLVAPSFTEFVAALRPPDE